MKKVYHAYSDSGHGWCKVSLSELKQLGIHEKITPFSYRRGDFVYLEEDCDLTTFHEAKRAQGVEVKYICHYTHKSSKIRSYNPYYVV